MAQQKRIGEVELVLFLPKQKNPDMHHKYISLGDSNRDCQEPTITTNIPSHLRFVWKSGTQT